MTVAKIETPEQMSDYLTREVESLAHMWEHHYNGNNGYTEHCEREIMVSGHVGIYQASAAFDCLSEREQSQVLSDVADWAGLDTDAEALRFIRESEYSDEVATIIEANSQLRWEEGEVYLCEDCSEYNEDSLVETILRADNGTDVYRNVESPSDVRIETMLSDEPRVLFIYSHGRGCLEGYVSGKLVAVRRDEVLSQIGDAMADYCADTIG